MNCWPISYGQWRPGLLLLSLVSFVVDGQQDLSTKSQTESSAEEVSINSRLLKGLWYEIPLSNQHMEGVLSLGSSNECVELETCQVNEWRITLDSEHLIAGTKITSLSGEIEDLVVKVGKELTNTWPCRKLTKNRVKSSQFYVFCDHPISGRIVVIKSKRRLVSDQFFQIQTTMKLFAVRKSSFEEQEILLYNKYVTQIGMFQYFMAEFAIDGNTLFEAISCYPCGGSTSYGYGWWQVDLGKPRTILRVEIHASGNQFYANTLQQITVGVNHQNETRHDKITRCGDFRESYELTVSSKVDVFCPEPVTGQFVTIIRQKNAKFRPDLIVLAEVRIFEKKNDNPELPPPRPPNPSEILADQLVKENWISVFLYDAMAEQAGKHKGYEPKLAIDEDPNTYSLACTSCHSGTDRYAWWKVTFTKTYSFVAVELLSSRSTIEESNYLQEFEVLVLQNYHQANCAKYKNRTVIPQGTRIVLTCSKALEGNGILIKRSPDSIFAREKLAIAEIKIYAIKPYVPTPPPPPKIPPGKSINLINMIVDQGGTLTFHLAEFAIDGNPATSSISCLQCIPGYVDGSGWWKIDLLKSRLISGVQLLLNLDENDERSLQGVQVLISVTQIYAPFSGPRALCGEVPQSADASTNGLISVVCPNPISGRYLVVTKKVGAFFKPDTVAIAEIKIFVTDGTEDFGKPPIEELPVVVSREDFERRVLTEEWIQIVLVGLEATQSSTKSEFGPELAMDGNPTTFSVAFSPRDGVAWWSVEFGTEFYITGVELVSSPTEYESNYLQEFLVRVGHGGHGSICAEYVNRTNIAVGSRITLLCKYTPRGSKLTVERLPHSKFEKDELAIAEISIFALKIIITEEIEKVVRKKVEEKIWIIVPVTPGKTDKDLKDINIDEILFSCTYCGIAFVSYSVYILVAFSNEVSVVGMEIEFQKSLGSISLPDFQVLVVKWDNSKDVCATFKGGKTKVSNNELYILCSQPQRGRAVRTEGTWTQRKQIVTSVSIYALFVVNIVPEDAIDMTRLQAYQSSTPDPGGRASNAIDGLPATISKAYGTKVDAGAWWKVDLMHIYFVKSVSITGADNPYEAYHLQQFEILVLTQTQEERLCITYSGAHFGPKDTKTFHCSTEIIGRYVLIRKLTVSYNKDVLTLAEVQVYVNRREPVVIPPVPPVIPEPVTFPTSSPIWTTPSTIIDDIEFYYEFDPFDPNLPEDQKPKHPWKYDVLTKRWYITYHNIRYFVSFSPSKKYSFYYIPLTVVALDGFAKTCSRTCYHCNGNVGSGFGWWFFEFPSTTTISEVEILPCNDGIECLRDIVVGVSDWNTTNLEDVIPCAENVACPGGKPTWMRLRCHTPVTGNYLIIIRKKTIANGVNALSLAEIRVKDKSNNYVNFIGVGITGDYSGKGYETWENDPFDQNSPGYKNEVWNYDPITKRWYLLTSRGKYHITPSVERTAKFYYLPFGEGALDGYSKTCSWTCNPCRGKRGSRGFWSFKFPTVTTIAEVQLLSCYDGVECLRDIVVGISETNTTDVSKWKVCTENDRCSVNNSEPRWLRLSCHTPVSGRYLMIVRKNSKYGPLAIAELRVKDQYDRFVDMLHAESFTDSGDGSLGGEWVNTVVTHKTWTYNGAHSNQPNEGHQWSYKTIQVGQPIVTSRVFTSGVFQDPDTVHQFQQESEN